jgi:hypothetical protein
MHQVLIRDFAPGNSPKIVWDSVKNKKKKLLGTLGGFRRRQHHEADQD